MESPRPRQRAAKRRAWLIAAAGLAAVLVPAVGPAWRAGASDQWTIASPGGTVAATVEARAARAGDAARARGAGRAARRRGHRARCIRHAGGEAPPAPPRRPAAAAQP